MKQYTNSQLAHMFLDHATIAVRNLDSGRFDHKLPGKIDTLTIQIERGQLSLMQAKNTLQDAMKR